MFSKVELRRSLLSTRQSMPQEEWRQKSDRLCIQLQNSSLFTSSRTILAYFSFRKEPDLYTLFTDTTHRWGFPRCIGDRLSWHLWTPETPLVKGAYNIPEPHPDAPVIESSEVDLILVPSVACDALGYRLGYGGGYYDRLFSSSEWLALPTVGIIFNFAYLPQLPIDPWDKPLQAVCTEIDFHSFKS